MPRTRTRSNDPLIDATPVQEHIRKLVGAGMSARRIAELSKISPRRIIQLKLYGDQCRTMQSTATALLDVAFEPPPEQAYSPPSWVTGPLATRRRLQGMQADGFPGWLIRQVTGLASAPLYRHTAGEATDVHRDTEEKVRRGYESTIVKWPADFGVPAWQSARLAGMARRKLFVPRGCWDDDTIGDPDALPEWTGACGSVTGYYIHIREGIKTCAPCLAARQEARPHDTREFDRYAFAKMRAALGYSRNSLAAKAGVNSATIQYWEAGRSQPTSKMFEKVVAAMGRSADEFYKEDPT